jgi:CheY-like chemotaxis protein
MARVVIADDSAAFRALAARLVRAGGHQVAGEASDAAGAIRLVRALEPDALLLDVHLGTADGWEVAREVSALTRVIMVSSDPEAGSAGQVLRSRAERFVPKAELAAGPLL